MYLTRVVIVLQCMRPLVTISPHLGWVERESSGTHTVSPLVSVGVCVGHWQHSSTSVLS